MGQVALARSVIRIPGMDCPAEEGLVRLALAPLPGIRALAVDLPGRRLEVLHEGPADALLAKLQPLGLGAALEVPATASTPPSAAAAGPGRVEEAATLRLLLAINAVMFVVEIVAGWLAESTALLADSLDMLADAAVYGVALFAAARGATAQLRAARLAGVLQAGLALGALAEVLRRLLTGSAPEPLPMVGIALVALAANVTCLWLVSRQRGRGAHMEASYIFSANDVLANAGVIVAGALVAWTGSAWPDLVIGAVIGLVVLAGARRILALKG